MRKYFFIILISIFFTFSKIEAAEIGETVGYSVPIESVNVLDGNIICKENNNFVLCTEEYSTNIAGVYNEKPALYIDNNIENNKPLIASGKAWVQVTSLNGIISKGDYITTSKVAGVGMKASDNGNILGIAMEDYQVEDKNTAGKISVLVGIKSVDLNSGSSGNKSTIKNNSIFSDIDAYSVWRYWIAILICIISFTIGFIYFGRISKTGLEAMGRNPLAGRMIQINIILNIILITLIMIGGIALAYAIVFI